MVGGLSEFLSSFYLNSRVRFLLTKQSQPSQSWFLVPTSVSINNMIILPLSTDFLPYVSSSLSHTFLPSHPSFYLLKKAIPQLLVKSIFNVCTSRKVQTLLKTGTRVTPSPCTDSPLSTPSSLPFPPQDPRFHRAPNRVFPRQRTG